MSFADRVEEQAKYFGLTPPQTVQLGAYAKHFTKEKLTRPFTIRTCMQDAMGRSRLPRFYAFVKTCDGEDLAESLVANGLARVHGSAGAPIGLTSPEREWRKLQRLEQEAKQQKVGGWGATSGRMTARLPQQPAKTGPDSFDAFFHPEKVAAEESKVIVEPTAAVVSSTTTVPGAKLDVNSATSAELLNIPGVGPVIASRIIAARPFKSADDLRNVKGIGAKKFEKLRSFFGG